MDAFLSPPLITRTFLTALFVTLAACGGGGGGGSQTTFTVSATASENGSISPGNATVNANSTTTFTVTPDNGFAIDSVSGCSGTLSGSTYTTGAITANCTVTARFIALPPASAAVPELSYTPVKGFTFTWTDETDATFYRLQENPDGASGFTQVGEDIAQGNGTTTLIVPLHKRINARYILQSCNAGGCIDATEISVAGTLATSIGYVKASNTEAEDKFGTSISLSGDGNTLAVGTWSEDSSATGVNGEQGDNSADDSGAVYVFIRSDNTWIQQAYIKASNTGTSNANNIESSDNFGAAISLSDDGNTLAVGAIGEDSSAVGINGNQVNNSMIDSGAVYVFTRSENTWSQQAYIKPNNTGRAHFFGYAVSLSSDGNTLAAGATNPSIAGVVYIFTRDAGTWSQQSLIQPSNPDEHDFFGEVVSLSSDGNTLAVGTSFEASNATGVNGDQTNNNNPFSGAVYVFTRTDTTWSQQAYIKASNSEAEDSFGISVSLSSDGNTLAVGALDEDSNATGINSDQTNNSTVNSGAVYVFARSGSTWTQQAYIKASNTEANDRFGIAVDLSSDGNMLAVGAFLEDSNATGINDDQSNNSETDSGAVYLFTRSGSTWNQQSYIKASNSETDDRFGIAVNLSSDGNILAVGAFLEDSNATGVDGDQANNEVTNSGAVYLY